MDAANLASSCSFSSKALIQKAIDGSWDNLRFLQWAAAISTLILTVGAVIEYWEIIWRVTLLVFKWVLARSTAFDRCTLRKLLLHSLGPIMVTLGIAGELLFESRAFIVEDHDTAELVGDVGTAKQSAIDAASAAGEAKAKANAVEVEADQARTSAATALTTARSANTEAHGAEHEISAVRTLAGEVQKEAGDAKYLATELRRYTDQEFATRRICLTVNCNETAELADRRKLLRKRLEAIPGLHAIIQPAANNGEAANLAEQISSQLSALGWSPTITDEQHSKIPNAFIRAGVELVILRPPIFQGSKPQENETSQMYIDLNVGSLNELLNMDLGPSPKFPDIWGAFPGFESGDVPFQRITKFGFKFPEETVVILVGEKPQPRWNPNPIDSNAATIPSKPEAK